MRKDRRPPWEQTYNPEFCLVVYELCLLGLEDKKIANVLNVPVSHLKHWAENYPDFESVFRTGRELADAKVATALFKRATGYEHPETKVHFDKFGKVTTEEITKHHPPDTQAAIKWLELRQKDLWKQKDEIDLNATIRHGKLPKLEDLFGEPDTDD
jgi:hypothetical protein